MIRPLPPGEAVRLSTLVDYRPGEVASRTLARHSGTNVSVCAVPSGVHLRLPAASGDALLHVLDGVAEVSLHETRFQASAGETVAVPAGTPHTLTGPRGFKALLLVLRPLQRATW
ncbi:MAG: cupin domain-containing protein [Bacteroidota bacterium]